MIDPIWWFYLFWVPDFLQRQHGLRLIQIGLPILVIYVIADVGSVAGGWLSSSLTNRGVSVDAGRKIAMLVCAVSVVPIAFAHRVSGLWLAVLLIGLAAAGHQGFSANLFTLTSDLFPSRAVASVVGIGGMAGALGGMLIAEIVGYVLQWSGTYRGPFLIVASAYLVALALIHLLNPKLAPAELSQASINQPRGLPAWRQERSRHWFEQGSRRCDCRKSNCHLSALSVCRSADFQTGNKRKAS